jgi:acyl carrier protein
MSEDLIEQLKIIISEEFSVNLKPEEMDETVSLFRDGLGLDSVEFIRLFYLIEERFGLYFSESDLRLDNFKSLTSLADFIADKMNQ